MRLGIALLLSAVAAIGCQQNIGDSCSGSSDCSQTGERQCDLSQPGGYCTVFSCDPDTCPEGSCVEWRFIPSRTAETWCMQGCADDGICRNDYWCVLPANIDMEGVWQAEVPVEDRVARVIDLDQVKATGKICVALTEPPPPESERDAVDDELEPRAGALDAGL